MILYYLEGGDICQVLVLPKKARQTCKHEWRRRYKDKEGTDWGWASVCCKCGACSRGIRW